MQIVSWPSHFPNIFQSSKALHEVRGLEEGISHDPQHLRCENSMVPEPRWRDLCCVGCRANHVPWSARDGQKELKDFGHPAFSGIN